MIGDSRLCCNTDRPAVDPLSPIVVDGWPPQCYGPEPLHADYITSCSSGEASYPSGGSARYPNLLSSIKLGPLTLRHRVVVAGHSMLMGESDGRVGERLCAYLATHAQGGAALIGMESAPVHPGSVHYAQQLRLYDDGVRPGLARAAEAVHAAGSLLSIILWHGGHNVTHFGGRPGVAPSPIPSHTIGETPKVLNAAEIREIVAAYGSAARRCRDAGLDAVEVQIPPSTMARAGAIACFQTVSSASECRSRSIVKLCRLLGAAVFSAFLVAGLGAPAPAQIRNPSSPSERTARPDDQLDEADDSRTHLGYHG